MSVLWIDVLNKWLRGIYWTYPSNITDNFFWNTSPIELSPNSFFIEKFKITQSLPQEQDSSEFDEYFMKSDNKHVVAFPNLNENTILVVPMPRKNKNYATLKHFSDSASAIQQRIFWKKVATIALKELKQGKKIWISTHGLGVSYLHVRISTQPKYYFDQELA